MPSNTSVALDLVRNEWATLLLRTSDAARHALNGLATVHAGALADDFYAHMLSDPQASMFLSSQQVHDKLHASMQVWIADVLQADAGSVHGLIAAQQVIGDVHARIGIPMTLVSRGARRLKTRIHELLKAASPDAEVMVDALIYVHQAFDIALEVMAGSYSHARDRSTKTDEAYRLFSLVHNISTERERQRAALLDWENAFVYRIAQGTQLAQMPTLSASDFGLWFHHKGQPSFGDDDNVLAVASLIRDTDLALSGASDNQGAQARMDLLQSVRDQVAQIKYLLASMFEKVAEAEAGRDTLTQLLNRRFVGTVLRREVAMAMRKQSTFAVLMVDIDLFKSVNDTYGHDAGDRVIQCVAMALLESIRASDYAFRYGGEEFLLVLVETTHAQALEAAERIRRNVGAQQLQLTGGARLSPTVSIGVAMQGGHPDYEQVIAAADSALYEAKRLGRNQVFSTGEVEPSSASRRLSRNMANTRA